MRSSRSPRRKWPDSMARLESWGRLCRGRLRFAPPSSALRCNTVTTDIKRGAETGGRSVPRGPGREDGTARRIPKRCRLAGDSPRSVPGGAPWYVWCVVLATGVSMCSRATRTPPAAVDEPAAYAALLEHFLTSDEWAEHPSRLVTAEATPVGPEPSRAWDSSLLRQTATTVPTRRGRLLRGPLRQMGDRGSGGCASRNTCRRTLPGDDPGEGRSSSGGAAQRVRPAASSNHLASLSRSSCARRASA